MGKDRKMKRLDQQLIDERAARFRQQREERENPNGISKNMDAIHIPSGLKVFVMARLTPNNLFGCRFPRGAHITIDAKFLKAA